MLQLAASGPLVDVTGPRSLRPRRGIRLHRVAQIPSDEIETKHGLPITSPARTILDLASCNDADLENILARAERLGLVTPDTLDATLARHPHARGTRLLRALLSAGAALTRSEAERLFLALVRKAALQHPEVNANVEGIEVDFVWRNRRLVVEIDGFAYHSDRESFENDRRRDAILAAAGYRVIRFTWRQLTASPEVVLIRLSEALAQR
jgi:very-short-patch-repair endonuclease